MGMDSVGQFGYTNAMSARSVMIYLRRLRDRHGWSRAEFERVSGLTQKQIYRWERVDKLPDIAELGTWARAVRASFHHIETLLREEGVSEAAAQALADDRWDELQDPGAIGAQEALDLISRLRAHPVLLGRWLEYGERLIAGAADNRSPRDAPTRAESDETTARRPT